MNILIVDDSRFTRALLRREFKGWQIREASDGCEALKVYEEGFAPDVVLVDLLMPNMNGFDLVKALRDAGLAAPIVVCSANTQSSVEVRVLELGATEFVAKPDLLTPGRPRALVERITARTEQSQVQPSLRAPHPELPSRAANVMKDGMNVVADILGSLTAMPVSLGRSLVLFGQGSESRTSFSTVKVSLELDGGMHGTASLTLPRDTVLAALRASLSRVDPPPPGPDDVAIEVGNILLNAFVSRLGDELSGEVVFGELKLERDVSAGQNVGGGEPQVSLQSYFSLENQNDEGVLSVSLDESTFKKLVVSWGQKQPV